MNYDCDTIDYHIGDVALVDPIDGFLLHRLLFKVRIIMTDTQHDHPDCVQQESDDVDDDNPAFRVTTTSAPGPDVPDVSAFLVAD
mmetsp:Transcript_36693/g.59912  ORF Transcript_36693/g.59912 Transcript_36693/m.59912 type:complete len:85 (-) Transcript_36693:72-326(-)